MGNSISHCQAEQIPSEVPVPVLLSGESTETPGAEASNDAGGDSTPVAGLEDQTNEGDGPEEEAEEELPKKTIVINTAPIDPRFPTANAARYCYVAYNEYHKCVQERGQDSPECARFGRTYRSICPSEWIAHWNELREEGKWFGKY